MIYFKLSLKGSSVYWGVAYARRICEEHGTTLAEYFAESGIDSQIEIDAASLLAWLGY